LEIRQEIPTFVGMTTTVAGWEKRRGTPYKFDTVCRAAFNATCFLNRHPGAGRDLPATNQSNILSTFATTSKLNFTRN
jgi:hypothetical protein